MRNQSQATPVSVTAMVDDAAAIERQRIERTAAWNRGDAHGFTMGFQDEGSFTNIAGTLMVGRAAFEARIGEIFATIFRGSRLETGIRRLRFIRPDIAVADIDSDITGFRGLPPGVQAPDGVLRTRQLWVLAKDGGEWTTAAFHNVDLKPSGDRTK